MTDQGLSTPAAVHLRLQEIEADLAVRQNAFETMAMEHFVAKRLKEKARAEAFLKAEGTVAERTAKAEQATALMGMEDEARYEALKGIVRVLDTRAAIGMAILKAQGRS